MSDHVSELLQDISIRVKGEHYLTPDDRAEVLSRFAAGLKNRLLQRVITRLDALTDTVDTMTQYELATLLLDQHQQLRAARAAAHQAKAKTAAGAR